MVISGRSKTSLFWYEQTLILITFQFHQQLGVNFIFKIVESNVFQNFNITNAVEPDPACSDFTFLSDDYWKCKVHQSTNTSHHPVGTCSMGADSDGSETSVVDTKFRFAF